MALTASSSAGVYAYGGTATTGIFPTNTFSASNYWVDVVFKSERPEPASHCKCELSDDYTERSGNHYGLDAVGQ